MWRRLYLGLLRRGWQITRVGPTTTILCVIAIIDFQLNIHLSSLLYLIQANQAKIQLDKNVILWSKHYAIYYNQCIKKQETSYFYSKSTHNNNKRSTNWSAALEHVLGDKNTFLRSLTFDLAQSKQQVLVRNRRLISDQLAVSSKSSLIWYRLYVLVQFL